MKWPLVWRSTFEALEEDYVHLSQVKNQILGENKAQRNLLAAASKNDHRDPVSGQFIKAPKG